MRTSSEDEDERHLQNLFKTSFIYIYIYLFIYLVNTKRTYAAALRTTKQQNQTETKTQQHDEILNNHNHLARYTTYTRSNINTINRPEEQPKKLKTRLHSTKWGREFWSNFSATHRRDATGNNVHRKLKKNASIKC